MESRLSITPSKRASAGITAAEVMSPPSPRSSASVFRTNGSRSKPGMEKSATGHLRLAHIALPHRAAGHLQHPLERLQRLQPHVLADLDPRRQVAQRSEEHTSELQSLMRISYAVFCLKKKKKKVTENQH